MNGGTEWLIDGDDCDPARLRDLYCCRERPRWPWEAALAAALGAGRIDVRSAVRGGAR